MFKIDPAHKTNASRLGVEIKPSKLKNKKIDVFKNDIKVASIGDVRYNDYRSYIKERGLEYANERKRLYKIRHNKTKDKIGTPSFYADRLLWN